MPIFGRGFKAHVTSSCHDEVGKRNLIDISALDNYIRKLSNKILKHKEEITLVERDYEGAEIVLVSYGGVARAAAMAASQAGKEGTPCGNLRLITAWPFPGEEIAKMARKANMSSCLKITWVRCIPTSRQRPPILRRSPFFRRDGSGRFRIQKIS